MDQQIFFKALRLGRTSAWVKGYAKLVYPAGKWVVPKIPGSKLFVFTTAERARRFLSGDIMGLVVPCEVKNPVNLSDTDCAENAYGLICQTANDLTVDTILDFWSTLTRLSVGVRGRDRRCMRRALGSNIATRRVPDGSVYCDAIKCLK